MHYGDKEQYDLSELKVTVYLHETVGVNNAEGLSLQLCGIQSLQLIHPQDAVMIISAFHPLFKDQLDQRLEPEKYYLITIKQFSEDEFKVTAIEEVTRHVDQRYQIH